MDGFFEVIKAIIIGIVQGITEWLPISSTAHIILADKFLNMNVSDVFSYTFNVVIQLGSVLAVIMIYFHRLNPFSKNKTKIQKTETFDTWKRVIIACIPGGILGVILDDFVDKKLSSTVVIAVSLIVYGIAFIVVEKRNVTTKINKISEIDYRTLLLIGFFQALAIIPGTSRSGATIIGAIILGASRVVATELSFFMVIPMMVGASGLRLVKSKLSFSSLEWVMMISGFVAAFLVSLLVIKLFLKYIKEKTFIPFGYYRIALGILLIILLFANILT